MKFFKKSQKKLSLEGLEKAKEEGLITEEEFLRLKWQRAEDEYKKYLEKLKKEKR